MPLVLGVTGSIATGKSYLCQYMVEKYGAIHADADKVVHRMYDPGKPGFDRIVAEFGEEVIGDDGMIDRKKIGLQVFGKPDRMRDLTRAIGDIGGEMIDSKGEAVSVAVVQCTIDIKQVSTKRSLALKVRQGQPEAAWLEPVRSFAIEQIMTGVKEDLLLLGIDMQVFSSERDLVNAGGAEAALERLEAMGLIYTGVLEPPKGKVPEDWEPRPQTLFRSTNFGDDVDRPLKKSDGSWTYFANDIAYHYDKYRRGFAEMIDVWGADHGGYIKRMRAAVSAVTGGEGALDVKICQLVQMMDGGKPVRMSKRAGTFITLRDVIDSVGKDVIRFIMLTRKNDQSLEFDYQKVTEQSRDNPVFYVQYAHARCHSVLRIAAESVPAAALMPAALAEIALDRLTDPGELGLIRQLVGWPRVVESAAEAHEPHRIAYYLSDLAAEFHGLWNKGKDDAALRFIVEDDQELTRARLALVRAVAVVIASGLTLFGVEPVEELRS